MAMTGLHDPLLSLLSCIWAIPTLNVFCEKGTSLTSLRPDGYDALGIRCSQRSILDQSLAPEVRGEMAEGTTSVVIMGATGDLTQRRLLPELFNLRRKGRLPEHFSIVGYARSDYSDEAFRNYSWEKISEIGSLNASSEEWDEFARHVHYVRGNVDSEQDMGGLLARLRELEGDLRPSNRLFYLSIAPSLYEEAIQSLSACGVAREDTGWRRAVIEKPFGRDLAFGPAPEQHRP